MAFDRLQELGKERFTAILNALMRGEPAMGVARTIQQEWGEFQNVAEKTLTQQLARLRQAAAQGAFGEKVAEVIQEGAKPTIKLLEGVTSGTLERMEELSRWQRERILDYKTKEKNMPLPLGAMLSATTEVMETYRDTLERIQKMRFELGVDEYHGVVMTSKGATATAIAPNGTMVQKQVYEAYTTMEDIFNRTLPSRKAAKDAGI